jgi:O-acetyl-ADP-ribose deacetylase (regulator of RNase III)
LLINFPTKDHWRQPSKLAFVADGLADLVQVVRAHEVESIAIPPLGCGNGGLDWQVVRPLILDAFAALPDVRVLLFEPAEAPAPADIIDRRARPAMTAARAAILTLMQRYQATGYDYRLALIEVQKLAYLLQVAGEPLRLDFKAHIYGPYANTLQKALRNLEGHYTVGLGDGRDAPDTPLELLPGSAEAAADFLETAPETQARIERVARAIDGFETPFGMELLGTVHWVMHHGAAADDLDDVVRAVHAWNERKRTLMKPGHIRAAWQRLSDEHWA